jgi:beta-lactam-binding protein with PASTA domain
MLSACNGEAPKPLARVSVPNVINLPLSQAHGILQVAGLRVADDLQGACPSGPSHGLHEPVVLDQQPAPGIKIPKASVVHIHPC